MHVLFSAKDVNRLHNNNSNMVDPETLFGIRKIKKYILFKCTYTKFYNQVRLSRFA